MLAIVNEHKLRRSLARMLDENEFFSPHGIRALSRLHQEHPYVFQRGGQDYRCDPARPGLVEAAASRPAN